jgi:hypothetical protein
MGGIPDVYKVSRIAEGRSIQRAITAHVLGTIRGEEPEKILRKSWGRDEHAALLLKAAVSPTSTANFISYDQVGALRSLAPGSPGLTRMPSALYGRRQSSSFFTQSQFFERNVVRFPH